MVNKQPLQPLQPSQSAQSAQSAPVNHQPVIDALKRKFQRVNQEIVKQNVLLQEQAARIRQENHRLLQENVKIKSRANALESKLREAESICTETKVKRNRYGGYSEYIEFFSFSILHLMLMYVEINCWKN